MQVDSRIFFGHAAAADQSRPKSGINIQAGGVAATNRRWISRNATRWP
jgi:hypothetical protein